MKHLLIGLTIILLATPAFAWKLQTEEPYKNNGEPNYRYESSTGARYQYDLNDPGDKIRYQTDIEAQVRDRVNVDPRRTIDRNMKQRGGGIE